MTTIITIELKSLRTENWRSSWKTNNEKNKIVVGLWKSSQQIWGDNQPLKETRIDWEKQDMNNFLHQEDTLRTWINDKHHDSNNP